VSLSLSLSLCAFVHLFSLLIMLSCFSDYWMVATL
jgi:hypothetical protein